VQVLENLDVVLILQKDPAVLQLSFDFCNLAGHDIINAFNYSVERTSPLQLCLKLSVLTLNPVRGVVEVVEMFVHPS